MQGGNFTTDVTQNYNLGTALDFSKGLGQIVSYANSNKLVAFFGRANVNVKGNYFVSVSARYEGASSLEQIINGACSLLQVRA